MTDMETAIYETRPEWDDGPWINEPDRAIWRHNNMVCLIRRHERSGHLCGYVGVGPDHPFHGRTWQGCALPEPCTVDEWACCDHRIDSRIEVHGGLTYARACDDDPILGICHLPAPGEPDHLWWFGFDCAHVWDMSPNPQRRVGYLDGQYRTFTYVRDDTENLADQLKAAASPTR